MPHLIVKNRKVCLVNGVPITSANGAPCVCDEQDEDFRCDAGPPPCVRYHMIGYSINPCQFTVEYAPGQFQIYEPIALLGYNGSYEDGDLGFEWNGFVLGRIPTGVLRNGPAYTRVSIPPNTGTLVCEDDIWKARYSDADIGWVNPGGGDAIYPLGVVVGAPANMTCTTSDNGNPTGPIVRGGGVTITASSSPCEPAPPTKYIARACQDASDTMVFTIEGINDYTGPGVAGAILRVSDGVLFFLTDEETDDPHDPALYEWTNQSCPVSTDDQLWERCRIDGEFHTPSGFLPPNRIRISNEVTTSTVVRATIAGPYYDSPPNRQCRDFASVHYNLIPDDGGSYLTVGPGIPVAESCGATQDKYIRSLCTGSPSDPGDPVDPQDPAIRSRLPLVDLDGFDPETERRRMRQGGCCGQPTF